MAENTPHPIIPDLRGDDLHHLEDLEKSQLNLFMAGNQFMVMKALVDLFKKQYPDIQNVYYQTLPPGLQLKQILSGGARFQGRIIAVRPDIYSSVNKTAMDRLCEAGLIEPDGFRLYLHNRLVLMTPSGNPAGIESVVDLGRDRVRISQPDPVHEDIAYHIMDMYEQAGGDGLRRRIMEEKRAEGTTIMTVVHHRETPLRLEKKTVDVGPVWSTEAVYARSKNMPVEVIEPGEDLDQRVKINYYISQMTQSPNEKNATRFMRFIDSEPAKAIYEKHGFIPHVG